MNIKLLNSWIKEYLETKANVKQIAEALSLSSVSVEKIEPLGRDHLLDIEVTTNRPDLMSVQGIAREAYASLKSAGLSAKFNEKKLNPPKNGDRKIPIEIIINKQLINRVCAAVLTVNVSSSPQIIKDRLEASDIRSLNNVIDVTNYVMREIGHPLHAFDLDKLSNTLKIREGKEGEIITTLDKKEYELLGGEIVAVNDKDEIIDLLGIMGTFNSAIDENTKRILLFVDNNDPVRIRRASMNLGIRTDSAILNEKGVDPEQADKSLTRAVEILIEIADAKLESEIIDLYPNKTRSKVIEITLDKMQKVLGVEIPKQKVVEILESLSFIVTFARGKFTVTVPSARANDIEIPQDIIEEVARIYGYHKIPSLIPPFEKVVSNNYTDIFFWEQKIKTALKYWGFTEVYTSSLISEDMLEVSSENAVRLSNPLGTDLAYMRTTLIPGLLQSVRNNRNFNKIKIFEMSNVYYKRKNDLPDEIIMLGGVVKQENNSFFKVKGVIEAILDELGIKKYEFKKRGSGGDGADLYVFKNLLGEIELLDRSVIDFEINFSELLKYASNKKIFKPVPKFPSATEDIRIKISKNLEHSKIVSTIKKASPLVSGVSLLDTYEDKKTFRITYQSLEKNLAASDIQEIRDKIIHNLKTDFSAELV